MSKQHDVFTLDDLKRALEAPQAVDRPVVVLTPRLWLWRCAERLGYLKNQSYIWVRSARVPVQ